MTKGMVTIVNMARLTVYASVIMLFIAAHKCTTAPQCSSMRLSAKDSFFPPDLVPHPHLPEPPPPKTTV